MSPPIRQDISAFTKAASSPCCSDYVVGNAVNLSRVVCYNRAEDLS